MHSTKDDAWLEWHGHSKYGGSAAGLADAETNLTCGMLYLAQADKMSGGATCATVMRYQSGHAATRISGANRTYCSKARLIMASR